MRRNKIISGNCPDGHPYDIVREENFKFNILAKYWVYVRSKLSNSVILFGIHFYHKEKAQAFADSFEYKKEIEKHLF